MATIVAAVRDGTFDTELAALLWLLADAGVPVHVASAEGRQATDLADAVRPLARAAGLVTAGSGGALEEVLRQPVPFRPASGAVLIVADGRVVAAHFQRPPLRDAGGHIRPQGPAVLTTWDAAGGTWEHFAWGITPELADATGRRAGDFEIEQARRREYLDDLAETGIDDDIAARALRSYGLANDLRA